ncbi:type II toxin-antitoxin system VapC family toxin [uncultured Jatrophihabitans sp.]|uniref:type II toxin-antitoxin system VapC family toxin n=1 Tax=uncultured Jatrophihabitans sp. TaxID=1610747 RepID=UPI0035CC048F
MIAYFDTSALVPLLIDEPASSICERLWDDADDVVTVRIAYVEAAAAIAQARRLRRLTRSQQRQAVALLDEKWEQLQVVDIDDMLVRQAGTLADVHSLRGYDATHCAGAESINDADVVAASGDHQLLAAWRALGMSTLDVNDRQSDA